MTNTTTESTASTTTAAAVAETGAQGAARKPKATRKATDTKKANTRLDVSISIALGLTSYVDSSRLPGVALCRTQEPRDALDQFILAWERNDRKGTRASLGPRGSAAFDSLLKQETWEQIRAAFWHHPSGEVLALGYRFEVPGRWSQPEEALDPEASNSTEGRMPAALSLETSFRNTRGTDCGSLRMGFIVPDEPTGLLQEYHIDNEDLSALLRLVDSCAAPVASKSP